MIPKIQPLPKFASKIEAERYFAKQEKYFENGRYGLSPWHYKYLSMHKIKDRYDGDIIMPKWREVDQEIIFPWLEKTIKENRLGLWATQRGAAKSTILSFAAMETVINFKGANVLYTAEQISTMSEWFEEKLKTTYLGLDEYYRPTLSNSWPTYKKEQVPAVQFLAKMKVNGKSVQEVLNSRIYGIDTAQRGEGSKIEGAGNKLIIVDELFKHPYGREVVSKGMANITRGQQRVGSMLICGTCSNATASGLEGAKYLRDNADTLGINFLFVPATWFNEAYPIYDSEGRETGKYESVLRKDGTIDRKKAEELILSKRSALEKIGDGKMLQEFILQFPIYEHEIFEVNDANYWEQDTIRTFSEQKSIYMGARKQKDYNRVDKPSYIYYSPELEKEILYMDDSMPRAQSKLFVLEPPVAGRHYVTGVDTIPGNTEAKSGSYHVALTKCLETNQYVAAQIERTSDMTAIGKRLISQLKQYNNSPCLVEKNSIGALKMAFENEGAIHLLAKTPRRFRAKGAKVDYGLHVGDYNGVALNTLVRDYLTRPTNMSMMYFEKFFEEFMMFPAKINDTDFMAAMRMTEALHTDYKDKLFFDKKPEQVSEIVYTKDSMGRTVLAKSQTSHIQADGTIDFRQWINKKNL